MQQMGIQKPHRGGLLKPAIYKHTTPTGLQIFPDENLAWFTIEVTVLQIRKTTESQSHREEKATRGQGEGEI